MCLLTYFAPDIDPDVAALELGAENNPDGHGFAIVTHDGPIVGHGMDADNVIARFTALRREHRGPALFHSRIATAGETDKRNCHPFYVRGDRQTVLAHNGILPRSAQPNAKDHRSDTRILTDEFVSSNDKRRVFDLARRSGRRNLRKWMGYGNRIVILTTNPRYAQSAYIVNEKEGEWKDGVWYSNSTYRQRWAYSSRWSSHTGSYSGESWGDDAWTGQGFARHYPMVRWADRDEYWYQNAKGTWKTATALTLDSESKCKVCTSVGTVLRTTALCSFCRCCNTCGEWVNECDCYQRGREVTGGIVLGRPAKFIAAASGIDQSTVDPTDECNACGYQLPDCRCAEQADELAAERIAANG